ncbi:MAG: DUF2189 domain-containing protein [Alphaproteobacteria bacterium]
MPKVLNEWIGHEGLPPSQQENMVVHVSGDSTIRIKRVDVEAPWRWLEAGWQDLFQMPRLSIAYGAVFTLVALGLLFGLSAIGMQSLILVLAGGFLLIGPILAVGLYEAARRREAGEQINANAIFMGFQAPGQLALLGLVLMFLFIAWVELAFFMFALYFGGQAVPPLSEFIFNLITTWQGTTLLIFGTIVGGILAATAFTISVLSAPMLAHRQVGIATAILASVSAVWLNMRPMLLWASLILLLMAISFATLFVGLLVVFPWIGYATWHAYDEIAE